MKRLYCFLFSVPALWLLSFVVSEFVCVVMIGSVVPLLGPDAREFASAALGIAFFASFIMLPNIPLFFRIGLAVVVTALVTVCNSILLIGAHC